MLDSLEVIDKGQSTVEHPAPLLFVHGAMHAAWCWDEHFLDFFSSRGFRAVALSLRGHGSSTTVKPLRACTIADFVEDVVSAAEALGAAPVVIGHSQGGFVVQKYLESHYAPAAVLVASLPPYGGASVIFRSARHHLCTAAKHAVCSPRAESIGRVVAIKQSTAYVRDMFFCSLTPEDTVQSCTQRLEREHSRRALLDMVLLDRPSPRLVRAPVKVLGAQYDRGITERELHTTARAYRTRAEIVPDMGHDMMLELGWAEVAERICNWLVDQGL